MTPSTASTRSVCELVFLVLVLSSPRGPFTTMSFSRSTRLCFRALPPRNPPLCAAPRRVRARPLSSQAAPPTPSRHAQFYTDYVAGMIPVALLGSAVYIVRPASHTLL